MCSLRDAATKLGELGVTVYGASLDDVAALAKFAEDEELTYSLLSDPDGSAAEKYGVHRGRYTARHTFIIDAEGVLRAIDENVQVKTHGTDLVERIERLMKE